MALRFIVGSLLLSYSNSEDIYSMGEADAQEGDSSGGQGCGCRTNSRYGEKAIEIINNKNLSSTSPLESTDDAVKDMVLIPGGISYIGSDKPVLVRDGEGFRRKIDISPFYIDRYEVSNKG
jgi:formylglycine-generating enzyme required for sulfatase activity